MDIYVEGQVNDEPSKQEVEQALSEIAKATENGDKGSYTPDMIEHIVFKKNGDKWNYRWKPKPEFNQPVDRIRRVTGYLVGTLDRFNDGKRAEEHDRVKHSFNQDTKNRNIILNREKHNCSLNDK